MISPTKIWLSYPKHIPNLTSPTLIYQIIGMGSESSGSKLGLRATVEEEQALVTVIINISMLTG